MSQESPLLRVIRWGGPSQGGKGHICHICHRHVPSYARSGWGRKNSLRCLVERRTPDSFPKRQSHFVRVTALSALPGIQCPLWPQFSQL